MHPESASIGEQIARLRSLRGLTQEQLAEASSVSVDTIRKLEQGTRATARLATLRHIADALGVRMSLVLAPPSLIREVNPPDLDGVRAALTNELALLTADEYDDVAPESTSSVATLTASITEGWRTWQAGDYNALAIALPELITHARALMHTTTGDQQVEVAGQLATACNLAAGLAIMLRHDDLAWVALLQARRAASQSGNRLAGASTQHFTAWIYRRQGRYDESERIATKAAEEHEPSLMRATPVELGVWGGLLINASGAAARAERFSRSEELLDLARSAAATNVNTVSQWSVFNARIVAQTAVTNAIELGDLERALSLAPTVAQTTSPTPPTWEARYLLGLAFAQLESGDDTNAIRSVLAAHAAAPTWVAHYRLGTDLTRQLIERAGSRRSADIEELVTKTGIGT